MSALAALEAWHLPSPPPSPPPNGAEASGGGGAAIVDPGEGETNVGGEHEAGSDDEAGAHNGDSEPDADDGEGSSNWHLAVGMRAELAFPEDGMAGSW